MPKLAQFSTGACFAYTARLLMYFLAYLPSSPTRPCRHLRPTPHRPHPTRLTPLHNSPLQPLHRPTHLTLPYARHVRRGAQTDGVGVGEGAGGV